MNKPEHCHGLEVEQVFHSNTGASVTRVRDEHGQTWVRKVENGSLLVENNLQTSQPVAVFLDHVRFHHGARLAKVSRCGTECVEKCNISPFIDGQSLADLLGEDNAGIEIVADLRAELMASMKAGGYFDQQETGCPAEFYRSRFLRTSQTLDWLEQSQQLQICGARINEVAYDALAYLCQSEWEVPMGTFPNDLNITNIFFRATDRQLLVIDQGLSLASPGVPTAKMIIGWRGLALLIPSQPDWSQFDPTELFANVDLTQQLDSAYLKSFFSYYAWAGKAVLHTLSKEIAAVQIMKTFITLNKYVERQQLPPQAIVDRAIGPFFNESVDSFYTRDKQYLDTKQLVVPQPTF